MGTILNDDAVPKITVADISVKEGNTGSATAVITINLTETAGSTVNVSFATKDISALAVSDYVATSGKISFSPGTSTQSISVQISSDTLFETDESFAINLSNPGNATILDSQSIVTILNDDLPPKIFVADRSINEGNSGTVNAVFVLTLSQASALPVSANFFTKDITATAGVDYAANSGTISFPAGTTTKSITLLVKGDDLFEKDETFSLNLASPTDASIADDQAIGTIVNDDAIPLITIADASFREGDAGTTTANISVTLSHPSAVITTVQYATADGSANSSSDYTAKSGTLMIPAGATAQNIVIELIGDIEFELNETFLINLLNPTNSAFGDSSATITILNDDSPPSVSISNASVTEGNSGNVSMTFPLSLSKIVQLPVSVQYKTSDGTAMAGIDYSSQSGTVTFPPGSQNQTVKVQIRPDTILETDETFFIDLSSPTNSTIANRQGVGTIIDDEPTIAMQTDFFTGEGQRINFLFVVDRSLTMDPIFSTVIDETENFIATLQQRRTVNWWAAVTVVDVRWLMEKNGENMLVTAGSTEVVKSTTTPDPINTLKENLLATQRYNTHERGLDAARFALEREGQKFMRPDVNLALIWATDEEDKSCYNWNFVGGFYRSDLCSDQKTGERSVDHSIFSDFFKSMTTKPLLYPMIEIPGNKCSGWESSVGTRYITVQGEVGTGRTLDVCDTKASYQTIANDISARGECYTLSRAASGNFFTVFVNGVSIVQGSNGFTFDPATNQICFAGSQVPIIGAKIKVNYQVK